MKAKLIYENLNDDEIILYDNFSIDVDKCWEILEDSEFYSYYKTHYDTGFFQPPEHFKEITGIDVAQDYNLGNLESKDVEILLHADIILNYKNLRKLMSDLIPKNPEIKGIHPYTDDNLYGVIHGMVSKLNIDDIEFYIGDYYNIYKSTWRNMINEKFYMDLNRSLIKLNPGMNIDNTIQWVISPKTSYKIINEIENITK